MPLQYERSNYFGKFTWAFDSMRSEITKARQCEKEAYDSFQMSIGGEGYSCTVFKNAECMIMAEGRYPRYDNEISVTDFLAKELNLKIGDKVAVPVAIIAVSFFAFSYLASRRIKTVEIKELVVE